EGRLLTNQCSHASLVEDWQRAATLARRCLHHEDRHDDPIALHNMSEASKHRGQLAQAWSDYEAALSRAEERGLQRAFGYIAGNAMHLCGLRDDLEGMQAWCDRLATGGANAVAQFHRARFLAEL